MLHRYIYAALAIAALASPASAQLFFPMEATDGSDFDVVTTADTDVFLGIDYGTFAVGAGTLAGARPAAIPEAPNTRPGDAPRTGHFIEANPGLFADPNNLQEVALVAKDVGTGEQLSITGDYEVQVDIWMNYQTGSGVATEFGGLLLGHDGVTPGRLSGAGFNFSGDSGAAGDFRLRKAPTDAASLPADIAIGALGLSIQEDGTGSDGQYNPEIGLAYFADPQFDTGVFNAVDNENDFWQDALPLRNLTAASFEPTGGQGADQGDPTGVNNPPGDPGFRWVTLRAEVEPDTVGTGTRAASGVARFYLQATWRDDADGDPLTTGDEVTVVGPEVFIGTIDNSNDTPDIQENAVPVYDFSDPIALLYGDLFSSVDETGLVFGVFDNLIITADSIMTPIPGDFDMDGDVDGADFGVFVGEFQTGDTGGVGAAAPFSQADLNESGFVDGADFGIFVDSFQNFPPTGSAVPEPSTALVLATAVYGVLAGRRVRIL